MDYNKLYVQLISKEYDVRSSRALPKKLIICSTPRTGGHALCQLLIDSKIGLPSEYFQWQFAMPLLRRWEEKQALRIEALPRHAEKYGNHLLEKRSVNSTFAAKIFPENLPFCRDCLGDDNADWRYIYLKRRDRVAQTISLLTMLKTGSPFDSDDALDHVAVLRRVGQQSIKNTVGYLFDSERRWEEVLSTIPEQRRTTIIMENLLSNSDKIVRDALVHLDLPLISNGEFNLPGERYKQNKDLKQQIRAEFGEEIEHYWKSLESF